jgi:hypothetical protein
MGNQSPLRAPMIGRSGKLERFRKSWYMMYDTIKMSGAAMAGRDSNSSTGFAMAIESQYRGFTGKKRP